VIRPVLVQMFLSSAYLCPDCSTIANDSVQCPRCHSPVLSLAAVLNRDPTTDDPKPDPATPEAPHAHTH
jgi:hypothetical protein